MDLVSSILERFYDKENGELKIGGMCVGSLASQYGTPLYIYDRGILEKKLTDLRKALPINFSISYSVKANPNIAILKFFLEKGCGLEIASLGEFRLAQIAGCALKEIVFAGPSKTVEELQEIIPFHIGEIHVESELEIERITAISSQLGTKTRVGLRVNPTGTAEGGAMRMGGKSTQFGIDEECLDSVIEKMLLAKSLEFCGIHIYSGTQILDHKVLIRQYRKGLEISRRIALRFGKPLKTVDFGGGLGIPYFGNEQELNMMGFREGLAELMEEITNDPLFAGTRFLVEPGRYLVGEAGIYVSKINDIKVSRGKKYLILDGGMNHHLAASGNLGQVIKRHFPTALITKLDQKPVENVDIVGPLCTPLDTLAKNIYLPSASVDDLVGIFQSGAYGLTASPVGFLSHATPAEILIDDQAAQVIRVRGSHQQELLFKV